MSRRLIISTMPGERRLALLENDSLIDLRIERDAFPDLIGAVFLGRVLSVDRDLDAAFVDIGQARPGFLAAKDCADGLPSQGELLPVRVTRLPAAGKGPRLATRMRTDATQILPEQRTEPGLLMPAHVVPDWASDPKISEILVDDPALLGLVKSRLEESDLERTPSLAQAPAHCDLWESEGLSGEVEALLQPEVPLPSGASLLIEPVRTLTAIDVNSGAAEGRGQVARNALAVNLEAVPEIARQLRLRALSGLIVIDFLELKDPAARKKVVRALQKELKGDPEPARVFPMAPSGLVEMTRRRGRWPLHEILTVPCGEGGSGRAKGPATLAFEALRAARRASLSAPGKKVSLEADTNVLSALHSEAAEALAAVEVRLGQPLALIERPGHPNFEIVVG